MMRELIRKISNYLSLRRNSPHLNPPSTHEVRVGRMEEGGLHPQIDVKKLLLLIVITLLLASCSKKPKEKLVPNIPPQTYIYVEGRVDTVPAKVFLRWYGNDPDGYVVGYYYNWDDDSDTVFTTANCDTFSLSSAGSVEVHVFKIWAKDNEGAIDPTPASVIIPVTNSPPTIQFQRGTLPPDTTLPVATYYLEWHDVDGDSTVIGFYWQLNSDTPHFVPSESTFVTLTNLPPGIDTVYFWAVDENSAVSDTIADTVYIKPVTGNILLVDDDIDNTADNFYSQMLNTLGYQFTLWKIDRGLPYSPIDQRYIINNLGFDLILWYTGDVGAHVKDIYGYLTEYLDNGHKLFLTGCGIFTDIDSTSMVQNYMHVDSLFGGKTILPNQPVFRVYPDTLYPDTLRALIIIPHIFGFTVNPPAAIIYKTQVLGMSEPLGVMLKAPETDPNIIVFSVKLHKLGGDLQNLFRHILSDEFGMK